MCLKPGASARAPTGKRDDVPDTGPSRCPARIRASRMVLGFRGSVGFSEDPALALLLCVLDVRWRVCFDDDWLGPLKSFVGEAAGGSDANSIDELPIGLPDLGLFGPRTRPSFAYSHTRPRVMHRLQDGCSPLH